MTKHLTDEAIQAYLDHAGPADRGEVEVHLAECQRCRARLESYSALYRRLADDSVFREPSGLSRKVLARLEAAGPDAAVPGRVAIGHARDRRRRELSPPPVFADAVLLVAALASAAAGLLWFVDLGAVLQGLGTAAQGGGGPGGQLVSTPVLVAAGAVIVITYLINGFLLRRPSRTS